MPLSVRSRAPRLDVAQVEELTTDEKLRPDQGGDSLDASGGSLLEDDFVLGLEAIRVEEGDLDPSSGGGTQEDEPVLVHINVAAAAAWEDFPLEPASLPGRRRQGGVGRAPIS